MKNYLYLFFTLVFLFSCREKNNSKSHEEIARDTAKFTRVIVPDTAGCGWYFNDRDIKDTLVNELAIIKASIDTLRGVPKDTFLTIKKYPRLLTCRVPAFLMKPNDTILISGYVYWVNQSEDPPGKPIFITKIVY